ncbi:hypothetical protein MNBD_GAMMA12-2891 [hydrothermal vent metagenome]|uniref:Uncharacterized protein n=1 Tax=hydrothermal vent metagenome TaxID=652676 RepID=A0A3B0YEU7_9ZZZZ
MLEKTENKSLVGSELLSVIAEVFPLQLLSQEIINNTSASWEGYDYSKEFEAGVFGKSWDMLDKVFIETHASAIIYLEHQAFFAIFPAYLSYLVRNDAYNEVPFMVASKLTKTNDELELRVFDAMVNSLSNAQKIVIRHVLIFLSKNHVEEVMQLALTSYWKDMAEGSI